MDYESPNIVNHTLWKEIASGLDLEPGNYNGITSVVIQMQLKEKAWECPFGEICIPETYQIFMIYSYADGDKNIEDCIIGRDCYKLIINNIAKLQQ
jgi:hypothetical protein